MSRRLAALLLLALAQPAEARDDLAVVLCEHLVKGTIGANATYTRTKAEIRGSSVVLAFTVQILSTKPREQTRICDFRFDTKQNGFHLRQPSHEDCDVNRKSHEQAEKHLARLDKCLADLRRHQVELLLAEKTGLLPIPAAETGLTSR